MNTDLAQLAASSPRQSTWLIANAGSGKTKVLVDRLLRLLLSGARPGGILCLTFTNTAANEMLKRVQDILSRWGVVDDETLDSEITALGEKATAATRQKARQLFLRLAEDPEGLNIRTLHSFCQSLISRFPLELGVAPGTNLLEGEAAMLLQAEIHHSLLLDPDPDIAAARHFLLLGQNSNLLQPKMFFALVAEWDKLINVADVDIAEFSARLAQLFGLSDPQVSIEQLEQDCTALIERTELAAMADRLAQQASDKKTDIEFLTRLERCLEAEQDWFAAFTAVFLTKTGTMRRNPLTKKLLQDDGITERIAYWKECLEQHFHQVSALHSLQITVALLRLVQRFIQRYRAYKIDHALLDYGDQIALVKDLLHSSGGLEWVRYKLDCSIDHVFLDEAQDTSHAQWQILNALCADFFVGDKERKQTLFVVGDPKQSIYRFQGADAEGFFTERDQRIQAGALSEQALTWSYRSAQPILDVVDSTFARYRHADFSRGDATFSASEHLSARTGCAGQVVLAPPLEFEHSKPAARRWLAHHLAEKIHRWIGQRQIAALGRAVQAEDILILFRDRTGMFSELAHYLRGFGVPVVSGEKSRFLEPLAVQDCVALLRYLLCRNDDYLLACVLKSAFISMSEEDLMQLVLRRQKNQSLHEVLMQQDHDAVQWLADLRRYADFTPINSLLGAILHRPCPRGRSGLQAMKGRFGEAVVQTLARLEQLAIDFESTESTGLQGFVDHVLFRETHEIDRAEGAGAVRLSTIHSAKGQQAPIVIVPEVWLTAKAAKIKLYSVQEMPVLDSADEILHPALERAREQLQAADRAEHWRLLYVAMTRAAFELHLYTARAKPKAKPKNTPWYGLIAEAMEDQNAEKVSDIAEFPPFDGEGIGFSATEPARRYQSFQSVPVPEIPQETAEADHTIPDWCHQPVTATEPPFAPNFAVASPRTNPSSRLRGIALHEMMQRLCAQEQPLAQLQHMQPQGFCEADIAEMHDTIRQCLLNPEIATILKTAQAELEVITAEGDRRRLDCVTITPELITIIDFKSGQAEDSIPKSYADQLDDYQKIMRDIFPNRSIRTGILWLDTASLAWRD